MPNVTANTDGQRKGINGTMEEEEGVEGKGGTRSTKREEGGRHGARRKQSKTQGQKASKESATYLLLSINLEPVKARPSVDIVGEESWLRRCVGLLRLQVLSKGVVEVLKSRKIEEAAEKFISRGRGQSQIKKKAVNFGFCSKWGRRRRQ